MLTRCPACGTTFRITPEQLRQQTGRVRCGHCRQVFNALDHLHDETTFLPPAAAAAPATTQPPTSSAEAAQQALSAQHHADNDVAAVSPAPTFSTTEAAIAQATDLSPIDPVPQSAENATADAAANSSPDSAPNLAPNSAPNLAPNSPLDDIPGWPAANTRRKRRWPWLVGALLLLVALAVQLAITFRVELAVLAPPVRPALVALCRLAGCTVGLPTHIELIGIETSDLRPDPNQPGRLIVSATIENRAPFNQEFPQLELTLTDIADQPVTRKVFPPAAYLPPTINRKAGMPARGEIAVSFALDIGQLPANGYRLYIFYP